MNPMAALDRALKLRSRRDEIRSRLTSTSTRSSPVIPATCEAFCAWIGVTLSPVQRAIVRVAYDRCEPTEEDVDALEHVAPALLLDVPEAARNVVAAVCGARGGKSYVLVALRLVHGLLTRDLSSVAPGQRAVALVVAPNEDLRQEVVSYALGAMRSRPDLASMLRLPRGAKPEDTVSEFDVRRADGRVVGFVGAVATRGGYGGRGRSLTDAALDESAFFRDKSSVVNDADIFGAVTARVLPGGQTIVASTPWAKSGLLYELHERNKEHAVDCIAIHAPTLALNPSPWTTALVERERARDPDNARREFDAVFPSSGTLAFFDADLVDRCLVDEVPAWTHGDELTAGADFGFRSDSSALVLAWRRGAAVYVGAPLELRPQPGAPLKPSETVRAFTEAIAGRCGYLMADGHYREAIAEHLGGLSYAPAPTQVAEPYVRLRTLMREGSVRIVRHARLVQQLREVTSRPLPGGGVSIVHPRWRTGGHGDLVAALVLATWQQTGQAVEDAPKDPEVSAFDARRKAYEDSRDRPHWQRHGRGGNAPWVR